MTTLTREEKTETRKRIWKTHYESLRTEAVRHIFPYNYSRVEAHGYCLTALSLMDTTLTLVMPHGIEEYYAAWSRTLFLIFETMPVPGERDYSSLPSVLGNELALAKGYNDSWEISYPTIRPAGREWLSLDALLERCLRRTLDGDVLQKELASLTAKSLLTDLMAKPPQKIIQENL